MAYPTVAILLMTYRNRPERTKYAVETVKSLRDDLIYDGERIWYVADNGSDKCHMDAILAEIGPYYNKVMFHNEESTCGRSWNKGLIECYRHTNYVLVMEDDWVIKEPFDITRYVVLMEEHTKVGMVRFGTLTVGMKMMCVGYNGHHYLQMDKKCQYAYSGNPHLRHKRLNKAVGLYNENIHPSPGDVEIDFDTRFRRQDQVDIIRPAGIEESGAWGHIGTEQSYEG